MAKHIGIVACSCPGAALCYETICNEGSKYMGKHAHPEVSMHNLPLSEYMEYCEKYDWESVAKLMLISAEKLANIGADFLICPDNTIHESFSIVEEKSPIPWLHIAEEVAKIAKSKNYQKVGVLGTKFLMEGPVYTEKLQAQQLDFLNPDEQARMEINRIIFDELVYGIIQPASTTFFLSVIEDLKSKGCDSVVLGCTEIPLIVMPEESALPVLDSTRLLARAALKFALG